MNMLAIDTTCKKASVSILKDNTNTIFKNTIDNEITHSEKLMPLIDDSLKQTSLSLKDIDLLACVLGPGSFTGIRIGISSIKALAKVLNKKIFGVSTLEVMAYDVIKKSHASKYKYILSVMDAKNDRVYFSLYKIDYLKNIPVLETVIECSNSTNTECCDIVNNYFSNISEDDKKEILMAIDNVDISLKLDIPFFILCSASDTNVLIQMIQDKLMLGDDMPKEYIFDYLTLDAVYARKSVAEREKYGE